MNRERLSDLGEAILNTTISRRGLLGSLIAAEGFLAACSSSNLREPASQVNANKSELTPEQIILGRKYKADTKATFEAFITDNYLKLGLDLEKGDNPEVDTKNWFKSMHENRIIQDADFRRGNIQQRITISNRYRDGIITETWIYPGGAPIRNIEREFIPGDLVDIHGYIPTDNLKAVAEYMFKFPPNILWEQGEVCFTMPMRAETDVEVAQALFARGKLDNGANLNFSIDEVGTADLRVALPSIDQQPFEFQFRC